MSWIPQHFDEGQLLSGNEFSEIAYELVGEEVQRLSVVNSLPALLQGSDGPLCMQRIVPKILLALDKASKEFHVAAALNFYTILEKKLVHPKTYSETFLRSMIDHIDFKVAEVAGIWLDVLLDAIAILSVDAIRAEILPVAIAKGQISQPVASRVKACRLLGKASLRLDSFYMKKEILPVILSLCQDVNHEVRACICTELSNTVKTLDAEVCKTMLLPSLVELASDEEAMVRIAAVSTIVEVLNYLQPDSIRNTIVPLVKKLCNQAKSSEDDVLVSISFQIGKLCLGLQHYMSIPEKQWLLAFYQDMAHLGVAHNKETRKNFPMPDFNMSGNADRLILCRQNCAYNLPAMAVFCMNLGDSSYEHLYGTFCNLAADPFFMVRRTIACGFHEVTSVLGSSCGMVKSELVKLLRDDVDEVLQGMIPNLSRTMEQLAKYGELGPDNMDSQSVEIGRAVLKCEAEINETRNWRLHSMLMGQLECLPLCLPSEFLHNYFIPIIFARIHKSRAVPCRVAAARTLLVFLRYNPKAPQRNDLRTRIISEFCRGRSCFARMAFAKLCGSAMDIFSRHYFKEHFYLQLLELHEDKVANVRMQLVGFLPRLKAMLRLPGDKKLLATLDSTVRRLTSNETDRDVIAMLQIAVDKMNHIMVRDEATGPLTITKEDLEDQRKAEEENKMASMKMDGARKNAAVRVPLSRASPVTQQTVALRRGLSSPARGPEPVRFSASPGRGKLSGQASILSASQSISQQVGQTSPSMRQPLYAGVRPGGRPSIRPTVTQPASQSVGGPSPPLVRSSSLASLEDEFYVDAGIRIPQQLAASGELASFPSRIPNLREILFKNRNINGHNENPCIQYDAVVTSIPKSLIVSTDVLEEAKLQQVASLSSSSFTTNKSGTSETKTRLKQISATGVVECSSNVKFLGQTTSVTQKECMLGSNSKQTTDIYRSNKVDSSRSSKGKTGTYEQKQKDISTVVHRRHSYMDGEKPVKSTGVVIKNDNSATRKITTNSGNRRHSYIEKYSVDEGKNSKSTFAVRRSYIGTTNVARHSYMEMEQSSGSSKIKGDVTLRKTSIPSRRNDSDALNKRRSLIYVSPQVISKGSSLERRCEFEVNSSVDDRQSSQIPKHPHSLAVESKRRHSSLERDDLEKLRTPTCESSHKSSGIHTRSLRSSLECINSPKPVEFEKKSQIGYIVDKTKVEKSDVKKDGKTHEEKLGYSTSDENLDLMIRKRNRLSLSKIPRGPASCHSSPGGSRASSPTYSLSNGIVRGRQRTAPNSRSTSPTNGITCGGNIRRNQRLSLGSLNSYMSNLKLSESSSRLPIRKPPP